jgi:hypothetical protein
MRSRRRFVPQVDALLSRIVLDASAGAATAAADPTTVVVSTCPTNDFVVYDYDYPGDGSSALSPSLPDDSDGTTASPVIPDNPMD